MRCILGEEGVPLYTCPLRSVLASLGSLVLQSQSDSVSLSIERNLRWQCIATGEHSCVQRECHVPLFCLRLFSALYYTACSYDKSFAPE